jgi:MFS family permease
MNDKTPNAIDASSRSSGASSPLRSALVGLGGASIEWYDFFRYGTAAALVFPTLFFSATLPPLVALIASFSTSAVGFVARPLGAIVFGHFGDRIGRKTCLAIAMIMMGLTTTSIGLLPPYSRVGAIAPLALVVLRFIQGLAIGGQWGGAILLATENAPATRRGLYGAMAQAGVPLGVVTANLAFLAATAATTAEGFLAYGWRIPFLCSIALVALGLFVHFRVQETPVFRELQRSRPARSTRSPVIEAFALYPRLIVLAAIAYSSTNVMFYILTNYIVGYATSAVGLQMPRSTLLIAVLVAQIIVAPAMPLAGRLSDRFGRRRMFMTGVLLSAFWAFAVFPLVETRSLLWIAVATSVGGCFNAITYGPLAALFSELFSTRVRYSAASLAYQLAAIIGGGPAPVIAATLFDRYHRNIAISIYMATACVVSLVCARYLIERRGSTLDEDIDPSAVAATRVTG